MIRRRGGEAPHKKTETKRSPEKKDEILQAALRIFLKKGYDGASTNDICLAASLSKPSLYYYFGSKRNLLFSVHNKQLRDVLRPYVSQASSIADPCERLKYMVKNYVKQVCTHPELRFLIHEGLSVKDKYFMEIRNEWKEHYLLLRRTISELKPHDTIGNSLGTSWTALFVLGMMTWITFWFDYRKKEEIERIAETAVEAIFNGIQISEGQTSLQIGKRQ